MDKTKAGLAILLLGAAGYGIHANWDQISEQFGFDYVSPVPLRAIEMAKSGFTINAYNTNYRSIQTQLKDSGGVMLGWEAVEITESLYLVYCNYREDDTKRAWVFEVDASAGEAVENVTGNPKLEKKYGYPSSPRY